ncbi:MAG: WD40 repeat domain-containing protein, partial [Planctomycetota bacterium]
HLDQAPVALRSWEWRHLSVRIDQSLKAVALGSENKDFALSPDGKRAAVCNAFGLHVVAVPSLEVEATIRCSYARTAAWDAAGERLAVGLWAGDVHLYRATGTGAWGEPVVAKVPQDIFREPACLYWSGDQLIVGTRRGNLYTWNPEEASADSPLQQFAVLADNIVGLGCAPALGPGAFYAASAAGEILIHDGRASVERFTLEGVAGNISSIFLRDDLSSGIFSSDSADHAVAFADRGRTRTVVREGTAPLRSVDLDGDLAAVVGDDKLVHLVDMRAPMVIRSLSGSPHQLECVKMVPGTRRILTLGGDGRLRMWDRDLAGGGIPLCGHVNDVNAVAFDVDGRRLATGGRDGVVILWDAIRAEALRVFKDPVGLVIGTAFLGRGDEKTLLASTQSAQLYGWDLNGGGLGHDATPAARTHQHEDLQVQDMIRDPLTGDGLLATSRGLLRVDSSLQTPPDQRELAAGDRRGASADTRAWCTAATDHWIRGIDVVEDRVVSLSNEGTVLVHDLASGEECRVVVTGQPVGTTDISAIRVVADVAGSENRRLGLFVSARQEILAVDIDSGEVITLASTSETDRQLIEFPMYAEWIEDGRRFLVSTRSGLLSVWSTAPLEHLVDLRGHERWAMRIEESPRGDSVASLASFGSLRLWNTLSTDRWSGLIADLAPLPAAADQVRSSVRASAAGQTRSTLIQALGDRLESREGRLATPDWYLVASLHRMRREPASRALYAIAESRNRRSLETLAQLENAALILPAEHRLRPLLERALGQCFSVKAWRDARFGSGAAAGISTNGEPPMPHQCAGRSAVALAPFLTTAAAATVGPTAMNLARLVLRAGRRL